MTRWPALALAGFLAAASHAAFAQAVAQPAPHPFVAPANAVQGLTLTSTGFVDGGVIPDKYAHSGSPDVSPPMAWDFVPPGVVSFVLIVHDPDLAPGKSSGDVLHWLAFNIPGDKRSLPEGVPLGATLPDGTVQILNITKTNGYAGVGARAPGPYHHYLFELFALDTKLDLTADATRAQVIGAMEGHILAKAVDEGRFHRF
jgi:Raf kinase inhibitor-like YbhB/YbcL family protein